jgi:hypothetical protein
MLGFFDPEDGSDLFLRNFELFPELHGVINQIILFIVTSLRT